MEPPVDVPVDPLEGLTFKQQRFVELYVGVCNGNGTRAAKEAGYSEDSAYSTAWENLRKPEIKNAIAALYRERCMGTDEVLARLAAQARGSMDDVLSGSRVDIDLARETGAIHVIKKISYHKEGPLNSIELYDAQAALDKIARAQKLYTEAAEQNVAVRVTVEYEKSENHHTDASPTTDPGSF